MAWNSPLSLKLVFPFIFVSFLNFVTIEAQGPTFTNQSCSSNRTTASSAFRSEIRTLLASLSSRANYTEFYNNTVSARNSSDTFYGLFLCRGDVTRQLCGQCVLDATQTLSSQCNLSAQAVVWYDECMVRYSNRYFFSALDTQPIRTGSNKDSVADQQNFMRLMLAKMNETADRAARHPIGQKKYATSEANMPGFRALYSLAQCTPDLSPQDCRDCLSGVIGDLPGCCSGKQGGRAICPSCNVRYEMFAFYNSNASGPFPDLFPAPNSPNTPNSEKRTNRSRTIIFIVVPIVASAILFTLCCYLLQRKTRKSYKTILKENFGDEGATLKSLQFELAIIEAATNNFSHENRIGKGGFGEVYKGILIDERQIAVKRLSKSSRQGVNEFKNEVSLIAKLQHKNLVAFIGFCLEEEEKILIYEYVPNKSLDYLLFGLRLFTMTFLFRQHLTFMHYVYMLFYDLNLIQLNDCIASFTLTFLTYSNKFVGNEQEKSLSWFERYNIIGGIARGILYLHEYSRLKVIHRDLKPSNVLLDENMNPKISDFGLARIFETNQDQGTTNRVVGTYGYMSPEYAMLGQFSDKSDVFSFGVMVLEIITGKKNVSSFESRRVTDGLLGYVWRQWSDQTLLSILDPNIKENYAEVEIIKCIQIGLLCVQPNPDARPTMQEVVSYLSNHSIELPSPQEPAIFLIAEESSSSQSVDSATPLSVNEMSISTFVPR